MLSVTGFSALLTLLRMFTGFLIAKVVAIHTGPSGMAMLGQIQSVVNILNGIVSAPVGSGLVRYTAENVSNGYEDCAPWWKASLIWTCIFLSIIIPIGCGFSYYISGFVFDNNNYYWVIIICCLSLPLSAVNIFIKSIINGQKMYKKYIFLGFLSNIISTLVMITLIYKSNLTGALIAACINTGVSGGILLLASCREKWFKFKYLIGYTEYFFIKRIGNYVLMAITSAICIPLSMIFIRNIIVSQLGWDAAGYWQAIWKISEVYLSVITMALTTYYLPTLSAISNKKLILLEINKTVKIIFPIICILSLSIFFFKDIIINVLFTEKFHPIRELFFVQLIGDIFKILSWLYAFPMLSQGNVKWYISSEIIFSCSFVLFVWLLTPIFGVQGANIGYALNYIIYFLFLFLNISKIVKNQEKYNDKSCIVR